MMQPYIRPKPCLFHLPAPIVKNGRSNFVFCLEKLERQQKVYSYNCVISSDTRKANAKSKF